jgi:alpha-galactosidase
MDTWPSMEQIGFGQAAFAEFARPGHWNDPMSKETLELLTNPEVISIDQDPLGRQARRVAQSGRLEVWARPLARGRVAAGLFNRGEQRAQVTARWAA